MLAVAQQSYRVTFDPSNLDVMAIIRSLSSTKNVVVEKVEESPYNPAFVARMKRIAKGKFTERRLEDL